MPRQGGSSGGGCQLSIVGHARGVACRMRGRGREHKREEDRPARVDGGSKAMMLLMTGTQSHLRSRG